MSENFRYIASATEIDPTSTYVLPYEAVRLLKQLDEIREKRGVVSGHIKDAMEQSSETWHDNAPADALFGEMYQLDTRESGLVTAYKHLVEVPYPTTEVNFATIGSRVLCGMGSDQFHLDITGNLPLNKDEEDHHEVERGSVAAPMPQAMLGATVDSVVEVKLPGRELEVLILEIDQNAQRLEYDPTH